MNFKKILGKITYKSTYPFWQVFLRSFSKLNIRRQTKLSQIETPVIITPNHLANLDGFLIGISFPLSSKLNYLRFAVKPDYFWHPLSFLYLYSLGCFPVYKKIGLENSLRVPTQALKKGGSVVIFPQGKVTKGKIKPKQAKRGAAYLAIKTNTPILPVKIDGGLEITPKRLLFNRKSISITIGKPYSIHARFNLEKESLNQATTLIMKKIKKLH